MNIPITSKIKRSPLFKDGDKTKEAIGTQNTKGKDKVVTNTETKEKESVGAYRRACGGKTDGSTGTDPKTGKTFKCAQAPKGQEPKETETVTTTTTEPGEDKKVDVTLMRQQHQEVMQPWEIRQQNRATKVASRNVGKAEKRLERMRKRGLEGTDRFKAAEARLETAKGMQDRVNEGASSGYRAKTKIKRKEDRVATTGEFGDPEQIKMEARKQEIADQAGLTTGSSTFSQADQAITSSSDFAKMADVFSNEEALNYKPFESLNSPLGKTLQGNQYKLPQHLQEKIKAAPGKKRAPLKKGYFNK